MNNRLNQKIASTALILAAGLGIATSAAALTAAPAGAAMVHPTPNVTSVLKPQVHLPHVSIPHIALSADRSNGVNRPGPVVNPVFRPEISVGSVHLLGVNGLGHIATPVGAPVE